MQVTTVEPGNLDQAEAIAQRAASTLEAGGLVVFPTETVYGVGAAATSEAGVQALRALKANGESRAFAVHLPNPAAAERYVDLSSPALRRLVQKVFPGPVTLVVDVAEPTIDRKLTGMHLQGCRDRLYHGNTIALRCPSHELTQHILAGTDAPIIAGSANRRGRAPAREAQEAIDALGQDVDLVVDGGRCRYAKPSTVVRVTGEGANQHIVVEREGVYDERFIRKLMRWTLLLVCSGNTCRSPMAEGLARQMLAERRGIAPDELEAAGLRVLSAGVSAGGGMPANEHAVEALKKQNIDLSQHRARELTPQMVHEADVIYTMTEAHREAVVALVPSAADKTFTLDPNGDIEDPLGSGASSYQRTAELIRRRLDQRLKEQQP
ncbi:MAG: L-threonylcarbamoyladenylate synthase [Phycisphaeraceae bacterium]